MLLWENVYVNMYNNIMGTHMGSRHNNANNNTSNLIKAALFNGHLLCKSHFYMVLGHKCVLAVCEHNHPTMIKIHPLLIFLSPLNQVSLNRLIDCPVLP